MRRLRLRYLSGPRRGDELIFSGPRVRIGRSRDNTLVLTEFDAPQSSGRHAEAIVESGAWWIVDSGSTNGTFVNGARIERQRLAAGDRLEFGDDRFLVRGSAPTAALTVAAVAVLLAAIAGVSYATRRRASSTAEEIAAAAVRSVYAIVIESAGARTIVGTGFAVDEGVLATNAHVANALRSAGAIGDSTASRAATPTAADSADARRALAVRGDTYETSRIVGVVLHPDWRAGSLRADAATLLLEPGTATTPIRLAGDGAFRRLRRGTSLMSFGFPAVSTDAQHPRGRLSTDLVGDVRGEYLETGLSIAPGTSGSPVFDQEGAVVAVVAGGDFVRGANGALAPTGSDANWAISAERIRELLHR